MKHFGLALLLTLLVVGFNTSGCKKKVADNAPNPAAFDSAAQELKDTWTLALEADRTNDYYTAEVMLYAIIRQDPPPDQLQAARSQLQSTHHRMQDGIEKGDPDAKAAFEKIRMAPPNRPPPAAAQ